MSASLHVTTYACQNCGWSDFHQIAQCPRCNGNIKRSTIPGEGTILTYTTIRYPPKGFENQAPYTVAIIKLNGLQVIGRISNATEATIGDAVSLSATKDGVLEFRLSKRA